MSLALVLLLGASPLIFLGTLTAVSFLRFYLRAKKIEAFFRSDKIEHPTFTGFKTLEEKERFYAQPSCSCENGCKSSTCDKL